MSWLFGSSTTPFDELLDKATSELLPVGDDETLLSSLQLSDMIRSKAIEAEPALKSVRRRIGHKNPNVQIQALQVLDVLVKNSGEAFLLAVGSRKDGWLDQLEALCRTSNNEVRTVAIRNLQNWALAFKSSNTSAALSTADLVYLHSRLRYENVIEFPPISNEMNASMISSLSAPEWVDSDACQRCRTAFSMTNRKHHCRNCGGVFCGDCSSKKMKLGHLGIEQEVRVCDGCERKLSTANGRSGSVSKPAVNGNRSSALTSGKSQEELDFEQAIAMSLADSGGSVQQNAYSSPQHNGTSALPGVGYGYEPRPSQPPSTAPTQSDTASMMPSKQLEVEDPDLAAAIRASLAEVAAAQQYQPIATTSSAPYQASAPPTSSYTYTPQQPAPVPSVPSYDLAMSEFDALDSFSNALARNAQHTNTEDANELFYKADRHRGKMMRAMQDADVKGQTLDELNQKLQRAVRLYDALLERGIGQYQRPMYNGYQNNPPQQQQQYNPTQQEYYQRPQSRYNGPNAEYMARPPSQARASQIYSGQTEQPHLQRASSSSYPGQRQLAYAEPQYAQSQAPVQTQAGYAAAPPHDAYQQPYAHDPGHVPHEQQYHAEGAPTAPQEEQYYHDPQHERQYQEHDQASSQAAYPASAYPYNEPQPSVPYPLASPPLQHQPYPPVDGTAQQVLQSPQYNNSALPQQQSAPEAAQHHPQEQPQQMYDEHGNKLRLQGYYKPSSFPAAPSGPVGGLNALPDAPTGELHRVASRFDQPDGRQERKQEEALIEF